MRAQCIPIWDYLPCNTPNKILNIRENSELPQLMPIPVADPETSRERGGGGGGGEFANKLIFFPENISKYRNKVQTIILIKV